MSRDRILRNRDRRRAAIFGRCKDEQGKTCVDPGVADVAASANAEYFALTPAD
jgi:hypothetical protein